MIVWGIAAADLAVLLCALALGVALFRLKKRHAILRQAAERAKSELELFRVRLGGPLLLKFETPLRSSSDQGG